MFLDYYLNTAPIKVQKASRGRVMLSSTSALLRYRAIA